MFQNFKDCLFNNNNVYKSQQRLKSYNHDVSTEEVNKIALSSKDLIENQPDIDKIYLYAKGPYESKYQYLINKREGVGINHFNDPKAFIEYSNDMNDVYKNTDEYNPYK